MSDANTATSGAANVSVSDNQVWFTGDGIVGGLFKIVDYKVTTNQSHNLYNGYQTTFLTQDGSGFHFGVDRQTSAEVAAWWNEKIKSNDTTFGHKAEYLNFALYGTMQLNFRHSSGEVRTANFHDAFLGQGKSGGTNNWWFGIKDSVRLGNDYIEKLDDSGSYNFLFYRGQHTGVNTVKVTF